MADTKSGKLFEMLFQAWLTMLGYECVSDGQWAFENRKDKNLFPGKYYAREVFVGESSKKGTRRRVEFFLINHEAFGLEGLIVECKWQDSKGTTENGFFRIPHDIKKTSIPTIVIVDGRGLSEGIKEHLKDNVDGVIFRGSWSVMELISKIMEGFFTKELVISPAPGKSKESFDYLDGGLWGDAV